MYVYEELLANSCKLLPYVPPIFRFCSCGLPVCCMLGDPDPGVGVMAALLGTTSTGTVRTGGGVVATRRTGTEVTVDSGEARFRACRFS